MVTGASTANLAIILVDARQGVIQQTRRHAYIASLLRIPHLVVCVNKMDLVGYSEEVFNQIREDFMNSPPGLHIKDITFIPVSALQRRQHRGKIRPRCRGTYGPPLLRHLEEVYIGKRPQPARPPLSRAVRGPPAQRPVPRLPRLRRPDRRRRVPRGRQGHGPALGQNLPITGRSTPTTANWRKPSPRCRSPCNSADDIDISRGDMIVKPDNLPLVAQEFEAMVCWMHDEPLR
jgi:sulfate adenylyltransferase subunit 1 (EFTu-like GTPase family)